MPKFAVHRNAHPTTRAAFPLLLDVQSDLLGGLTTRVVVPLTRAASLRKRPLAQLTPLLRIAGEDYVMLTPQLAGVAVRDLGTQVASLAAQRDRIVAALDFLISGF